MAGKPPAIQFYYRDWLADAQLGRCSPASRGVWIDALSAMAEDGQAGELHGTVEELARVCRCSTEQMAASLDELQQKGAADVKCDKNVTCHGSVTAMSRECPSMVFTLRNRRMYRNASSRKSARERKKRERSRDERSGGGNDPPLAGHDDVTKKSRSPSSSSSSPSSSDGASAPSSESACALSSCQNLDFAGKSDGDTEFVFQLKGVETWTLKRSALEKLVREFPDLDVPYQLRRAVRWCVANPGKRKTRRGMPKFINGWMDRQMEDLRQRNDEDDQTPDLGTAPLSVAKAREIYGYDEDGGDDAA